jgi:hypothetical protein
VTTQTEAPIGHLEPAGLGWPKETDTDVSRETPADVTPAGLGWPS